MILALLTLKIWREISMASDLVFILEARLKNEQILEFASEVAGQNLKKEFEAILERLKKSKNSNLNLDFSYLIPMLSFLNLLSHWHDLKNKKIIISYYLPRLKEENSRKALLFNVILYEATNEVLKLRYIAIINKRSDIKIRKLYEI
jgi:hypothetical protein